MRPEFGIGVYGGLGGDIGSGPIAAGGSAGLGYGFFGGGGNPISSGGFYNYGGYMGGPGYGIGYPQVDCHGENTGGPPNPNSFGLGLSGGFVGGGFFTNANTPSELAGPFNNFNFNAPWVNLQFSWSGQFLGPGMTWVWTITRGGYGGSVSSYPTNTIVFQRPRILTK
jgi:hypothetical protein